MVLKKKRTVKVLVFMNFDFGRNYFIPVQNCILSSILLISQNVNVKIYTMGTNFCDK